MKWERRIDIESLQNRLLKVCYVPATNPVFQGFFFLLQPLAVLIKQSRQVVRAIKQSILLRCLWNDVLLFIIIKLQGYSVIVRKTSFL